MATQRTAREAAMFARWVLPLSVALAGSVIASAADLTRVPRTIQKEPAYTTRSPRYLLLAFGPDAAHRVWLVHDGDTLYVDRNGNGDLTETGEAVPAKKRRADDPDDGGRQFEAGDLTVGGVTHKSLVVGLNRLTNLSDDVRDRPDAKTRLRADPNVLVASVMLEVCHPRLKGPGVEGRVPVLAGPLDLTGLLVPAPTAAHAPVLHPDGPLEITFYASRPTFLLGRVTEATLVVGSPGLGRGTLTMLDYDQVIPEHLHPTVEVFYPARADSAPFREQFELKERC